MIYYLIYGFLVLLGLYDVLIANSSSSLKAQKIIVGNKQFIYRQSILFLAVVLFLISFASIRWNTGIDFNSYENSYNLIKAGESLQIELGFRIIAKILKSFTQLLLAYAVISVVAVCLTIENYSHYLFVSLLLFFSNIFLRYDMGIIRQGAAMALVIYSVKYAMNKQWKSFTALILLSAVFFHNSALIFLVIYPIVNKKISRVTMLMTVCVCIIIGLTGIWIGLFRIFSHIPMPMMNRYVNHFLNNMEVNFSLTDVKNLILLSGFMYLKNDKEKNDEDKNYNSMVNIYFIGTCMFWIFKQFTYFTGRGLDYFFQIEILLIPEFLRRIKSKSIRVITYILVCAYAFWYLYSIVNFDASTSWMNSSYIPYKTIFSN